MLTRIYRHLHSGMFNAFCGVDAIELDSLISYRKDLDLQFAEWTQDPGAGSFWDLAAIVALTKLVNPRLCFEIGTGRGRTTFHLALNTAPDSQIHTLDISNNELTGCIFRDKPEESKIRRWTGDSRSFDFSLWNGKAHLVYVDGGHDYEAVKADSATAFSLVAKGGCIIWDDFVSSWPGVARALRELAKSRELRRIAGTKLVCYFEQS